MTIHSDTSSAALEEKSSEISSIVAAVIILNAIVITVDAFPSIDMINDEWLDALDVFCELFFLTEIFVRMKVFTWRVFFKNNWNKFDFIIVMMSLPVLISPFYPMPEVNVLLMLRLARLVRIFKLLYFIPQRERLITGIGRALNASIGVFCGLVFLIFIIAVGGTYMFGKTSPAHFGNPIQSAFTIFQVFTMDGWSEVTDAIILAKDGSNWTWVVRSFFILTVIIGGILGLSMLNAVFVDQLISDQTEGLETRLHRMEELLEEIHASNGNGMELEPALSEEYEKLSGEYENLLEELKADDNLAHADFYPHDDSKPKK